MTTLNQIEEQTQVFAERRDELQREVQAMEARVKAIKDEHMPRIKELALRVAEDRDELENLVAGDPRLFKKPRTRLFAGIRVGLRKLPGKVYFDDEEAVIRRIRRTLPEDQQELLIRIKESVDKSLAAELSAADCKRLGITITDAEDVPYIKAADTEIDKLVDAMLADSDTKEAATA